MYMFILEAGVFEFIADFLSRVINQGQNSSYSNQCTALFAVNRGSHIAPPLSHGVPDIMPLINHEFLPSDFNLGRDLSACIDGSICPDLSSCYYGVVCRETACLDLYALICLICGRSL